MSRTEDSKWRRESREPRLPLIPDIEARIEHTEQHGVFLCTLRDCTPTPWNVVLKKGIWDPNPRVTNIYKHSGYKLKVFDNFWPKPPNLNPQPHE